MSDIVFTLRLMPERPHVDETYERNLVLVGSIKGVELLLKDHEGLKESKTSCLMKHSVFWRLSNSL